MVHTVDSLINDILRREGGYNDHKEDRGGATNHGVSLRYARGIGLDLDGDNDVDEDDIKMVTPEVAAELYRRDFFYGPRIDRFPEFLQAHVFDMAVNMGPRPAVRIVQRTCNLCRRAAPHLLKFDRLLVDGFVGEITITAVRQCYRVMDTSFINAVVDSRREAYMEIIARDPEQEKFRKGWMNRAEEFRV